MLIAGYGLMCRTQGQYSSKSQLFSKPFISPASGSCARRKDWCFADISCCSGLNIIRIILPVSGSLMVFLRVSLRGHPTSCTTGSSGRSWRSKNSSLPFLKTFLWKGYTRAARFRKRIRTIRISSGSTRSFEHGISIPEEKMKVSEKGGRYLRKS